MVFALFDFGTVCFLWIFILFGLPAVIGAIVKSLEEREANKQVQAQEKFKRENPELWRQQELLKLEKERLETQTRLAEEQARQENARRNVGVGVVIGRAMGWW
jgi:predicted Holliday junction resolvase-like endonuclease